ncbi:MAG: methyltransferase domain-containing protein [Patescibacteria group bacterium]|nr:methyltransferase domain-containing protein [Patescibacteria group bacterium]
MSKVHFLKTALQDYKVGALTPSSPFVVRQIVKRLPRHSRACIVEYGAGDGVITKALLEHMPRDGKLVAIEMNPHFVALLKKIHDPRLQVIHGNVLKVCNDLSNLKLPRIDAVVSGIPFSFFSPSEREFVAEHTFRNLSEHGRFILYQISPLMLPCLKRYFKKKVELSLEVRNFPPYVILAAEK